MDEWGRRLQPMTHLLAVFSLIPSSLATTATGQPVEMIQPAFYESSFIEIIVSEKTSRPVRRQYRFRLPGARAFLLATVQQDGRFSIVTTEPSASIAPIHNRMPSVLGPGESSEWLDPRFTELANRSYIELAAKPEREITSFHAFIYSSNS